MNAKRNHLLCAVSLAGAASVMGQTTYPDHVIQDVTWTSGTHHTAVTNRILSPGTSSLPVSISGTADAEFVSSTQVLLAPGFHAGGFTGSGQFHAFIDTALVPADLVVLSPDTAGHITDGVLHVEKWEKLEIGLTLPEPYQLAIDSFFTHYYSNGVTNTATPNQVDKDRDLNPYADDSLQLVMTLIDPSDDVRMKWGFYMTEAGWSSTLPTAQIGEAPGDTLYPYHVHYRFAPDEEGLWRFSLSIKAPHTLDQLNDPLQFQQYTGYDFVCDAPLPDNHGPLHVNTVNHRTLQFEDSTAFFGLGTNNGGDVGQRSDFDLMTSAMEQLHGVGGNFMRIFLGNGSFAPEWVNPGVYDHYHASNPCIGPPYPPAYSGNCQNQCWLFDRFLEQARNSNVYLQMCVDPYPPDRVYETFIWGPHAYVINFLEPERDTITQKYDLKKFFYMDGDSLNTDTGVFYYWKRKYKYIMARWGYSVNIAAVEPFNEVDQMLTYSDADYSTPPYPNDICVENRLNWTEDPALPDVLNKWLTDLITYIRDPVDTSAPASSSLGEDKKLFLMSYTNPWPPVADPDHYFLPFNNPHVDLNDVHIGMYSNNNVLSSSFTDSQAYRDGFLTKPFHSGEYTHYALKPFPDPDDEYDTGGIFSNYDVSFHNEIWASTFFGNFGSGSSWAWPRVFWWPGLPVPPSDQPIGGNPGNQWQQSFSNALGDTNLLDIGVVGGYPVVNRPVFHNFRALADVLSNPDWQSYDFFNGPFSAHKLFNDTSRLECYYLLNPDSNLAIGWVHNVNAYWENQYYIQRDENNYLGCGDPVSNSLVLPGFQSGIPLHVTYFPTRMDTTALPDDQIDSTGTGIVTLDLSSEPFHGIANNYLDTLHSDYAFIIAPQPVVRGAWEPPNDIVSAVGRELDFVLYPNPAYDGVSVLFSSDGVNRDVTLYDMTGKRIYARSNVSERVVPIAIGALAKGAYCVRVHEGDRTKMKTLIIN